MAWSDYDHPLEEEMVENRSDNTLDRYVDELDFRYEDNYGEIEEFIKEQYPTPSEAPDNLTPSSLAELAGRELEKEVSKVREFYTRYEGTNNITSQDYVRTLEYLGLKALRNGIN